MKSVILYIILTIYEVIRGIFLLISRPEFSIELLPVSWYSTIPSLLLPMVFLFFMYQYGKEKEENNSLKTTNVSQFLYLLWKFISDIGIAVYMYIDLPYALSFGAYNNYYSTRQLLSLVLFLTIDVIIIILLLFSNKKRKGSDANNTSS